MKSVLLVTFVFGTVAIISTYACNNCEIKDVHVEPIPGMEETNVIDLVISDSTALTKDCELETSKDSYLKIKENLVFKKVSVKCNKGLFHVNEEATSCEKFEQLQKENEDLQKVLHIFGLSDFNCRAPHKGKYKGGKTIDVKKWESKLSPAVNGKAECQEIIFEFEDGKKAGFKGHLVMKCGGGLGK